MLLSCCVVVVRALLVQLMLTDTRQTVVSARDLWNCWVFGVCWFLFSSKQRDLYDETFLDLVQAVLDGFNGTIFAYGQTGTGKTYTMQGMSLGFSEKCLRSVLWQTLFRIGDKFVLVCCLVNIYIISRTLALQMDLQVCTVLAAFLSVDN